MTDPFALIIEDDARLSKIFAKALQMANFETKIVTDGQVARNALATTTPAVVVLDLHLHLPHISGQDILEQIRSAARLAETRVMLATTDAHLADRLRNEADLVLIKPISFTQLRDLAARLRPTETS